MSTLLPHSQGHGAAPTLSRLEAAPLPRHKMWICWLECAMDKPAAMAGGSTHGEMSPMATKVLPWCCSMVGTQMEFRRSQVRYCQLRQGGTWWLTVPQ